MPTEPPQELFYVVGTNTGLGPYQNVEAALADIDRLSEGKTLEIGLPFWIISVPVISFRLVREKFHPKRKTESE